jgi:hypothetical protein
LAGLPFESCLLPLDPTEFSNNGQAHRFVADPKRRSDANSTGWWIHPEVKVFDVLPYNLDRKT